MHPFLLVFLDCLNNLLEKNERRNHEGFASNHIGEKKFLQHLLFGHIFNKEVNFYKVVIELC